MGDSGLAMNAFGVAIVWVAALAASPAVGAESSQNAAGNEQKLPPAVLAYQYPEYLEGGIYAQGAEPRQLLFRFKRVATRSGSTLNVDRDFTYPDGRVAAREHIVYLGNSLASYELEELQVGATGSARIHAATEGAGKSVIEFQFSPSSSERTKQRTEALAGTALIADMVGPFLTAHWDSLMRGEKVKGRYLVVQRKETVGFTFIKVAQGTAENERTTTIKMEPTSTVIGLLVRPLFFTVQKDSPHRVLRYLGRTTPKVKVGNKWEDLDAITVFDWQSAR